MKGFQLCHLSFAFIVLIVGCSSNQEAPLESASNNSSPLFTLLNQDQTGVDFQNKLTEGLNTNILMYEYFYNGGGVAAGDFNNDELIDLYFTSNMADNKLFINRGDFKFEDITASSGAGGRAGPWKTGVTVVDLNGDGKLDIYVCYSGALPPQKRQNQLFINQGTDDNGLPKFVDRAPEFGLNSPAFSNQAYFFDYDQDNDLDMLLLNHNPKSLPVLNEVSSAKMLQEDDPFQGIRLFNQQNGVFNDLTNKAGISGSPLTYGLGIAITDVNNDGWPDFYICNDYAVPDYLYINNQDGTFTDAIKDWMGHNSHFSMGNDAADINNDGWSDLITLDMLPEDNKRQKLLVAPDNYGKFELNVRSGFNYQYMRNMLQLNNRNGSFSEIGQLAGISNTDWSWSALIADYNNDGWKDLYITNGYFRDYTNLDFINYMETFVQAKGRLKREDVLEIISQMPSSDVVNYMYSNEGGIDFKNRTADWNMDIASNSNGAAYADLDNDGDLDLVVNNINIPAFVFKNHSERLTKNFLQVKLVGQGLNTQGIGSKVTLYKPEMTQSLEQYLSRGYLSAVSPILHFGLGNDSSIDSLSVRWPNGAYQVLKNINPNQRITLNQQDASIKKKSIQDLESPVFSSAPAPITYQQSPLDISDFERQPLLINACSNIGPFMAKGDLNGDELIDLVIGGDQTQSTSIYLQKPNGGFIQSLNTGLESNVDFVDSKIEIFDADADGYNDIYVASGGYHNFNADDKKLQDRLYFNNGKGQFHERPNSLPPLLISTGAVAVGDINQDNYPDLFIGAKVIPGKYPKAPSSHILINDGSGNFTDKTKTIAAEISPLGMVTDAQWVDINNDGYEDLIIVGEWMPITIYINENGSLKNETQRYLGKDFSGWWNTLLVADINDDDKPDLLVGNAGTNTQFKPTDQEPLEMYYDDFDNNGSVDPFFCFSIQGKSYPYVTRDELGRQLTKFRTKYTNFESYSEATMLDLFSPVELQKATRLVSNHLETTLFISTDDNKFRVSPLPAEVQFSPIYAMSVLDYNQDGIQDLLLCGNNNHFKLRLGKSDANYGILLQGNGDGKFTYLNQVHSGLDIKGDVRSILQVDDLFLFGINQGKILSYNLNADQREL